MANQMACLLMCDLGHRRQWALYALFAPLTLGAAHRKLHAALPGPEHGSESVGRIADEVGLLVRVLVSLSLEYTIGSRRV